MERVTLDVEDGVATVTLDQPEIRNALTSDVAGELVDAERAVEIGLFNRVYPTAEFDDRVAGFVDRVATGPTVALEQSKRLLEQGVSCSFDEAVANEAAAQAISGSTDDHEEGVRAFVESREPNFGGE